VRTVVEGSCCTVNKAGAPETIRGSDHNRRDFLDYQSQVKSMCENSVAPLWLIHRSDGKSEAVTLDIQHLPNPTLHYQKVKRRPMPL